MSDPRLYLIPGLGLDDRIFHKLELPGYDIHYLNWIEPISPKESIEAYAKRMTRGIDTSQPVILIGHSFGGIMAQEITQLLEVKKIILISSIKSRKENPLVFKLAGPTGLYRLLSKELVVKTFFFWGTLYGYGGGAEQRLLEDMFRKNSNQYLRWALKQLSIWNPELLDATNLVHIHGTKDRTFPIRGIQQPFLPVKGGHHFMVYQQPRAISELILQQLAP